MSINTTNLFQQGLSEAHVFARPMKQTDLGKSKFDAWCNLSKQVCNTAYISWKDSHDNSGRKVKVVDEATAKAHDDALGKILCEVATMVGNVSFATGEAEVLFVDDDFKDAVRGFCAGLGYTQTTKLDDLEKVVIERQEQFKEAKRHLAAYSFNGVEASAKAEAEEKYAVAERNLEHARTAVKEAKKERNAREAHFVPVDEKKFRPELELLIYNKVTERNAMDYSDWREIRRSANKAKRDARKAARAAAKAEFASK